VPKNDSKKKKKKSMMLITSQCREFYNVAGKIHSCMILLLQDLPFVGLAYQGKDIVFRFIIEYRSLRDFGP
jgi:hypothetical protein